MRHSLKNKKVLVTYGPTWIALDDMRIISNRSSGSMGKLIASGFIDAGAEVTVLEGPIENPLVAKKAYIKKFVFFDEFAKLFKSELRKKYDIVIHAAAVSDFKPAKREKTKIVSHKKYSVTLIPTEKLITAIKRLSPKTFLVGFKLESARTVRALQKAALESISANKCDLIVANSLTNGYTGFIFDKTGTLVAQGKTRKAISNSLIKILVGRDS